MYALCIIQSLNCRTYNSALDLKFHIHMLSGEVSSIFDTSPLTLLQSMRVILFEWETKLMPIPKESIEETQHLLCSPKFIFNVVSAVWFGKFDTVTGLD